MAIEFACACGARLRVPDPAAGRLVRCGKCQVTLRAPAAPPPEPVESLPIATDWVEDPPAPEPAPEPSREFEVVDDEAPVPNEVLVPSEEVLPSPVTPRRPRPKNQDRSSRRDREREHEGAPMLRTLLTLGGVALVAAVGLGALVWRSVHSSPEWNEHRSTAGGYKVDLPADPRDDIEGLIGFPKQTNAGAATARVEGTVHRRMEYAVIWADFPGGRNPWATDDQIIDAAVQGMGMTPHRAQIEPGRPVRVGGFNGREVVATVHGEGQYVFRIVVAETRLYVVASGRRKGHADHPDVRRFIDSFEVTDPHILSVARAKADAAERARQAEERRREEERRLSEERRIAEEKRLAEEKRREDERRAEEERKRREAEAVAEAARREAEAAAEKFRAAPTGVSAPDPIDLPGLVRYVPCDELTGDELPVWPKGELGTAPRGAALGPGVRGKALYLAANPRGAVVPNRGLPGELLRKPLTVAGWAKVGAGTVELFRASGTAPGVAVSLGPDRVTARVPSSTTHPDQRMGGMLSAPLPNDGRWHHVAFTWSAGDAGNRAALYVDGAAVAVFAFPVAVFPLPELTAGSPVLQAAQGNVFYKVAHPDLPVAAIDEVCLFDRALGPHEVRFLAGKAKSPEPPPNQAVRLAPHTRIEPLAGAAFDPERKAVWAVTARHRPWRPGEPALGSQEKSEYLVKYTYPDFNPAGRWTLPPVHINGRDYTPSGGPPALDVKNNRLFLTVYNLSGGVQHLQKEPDRYGNIHRFNLDSLPDPGDGAPPVLTAAVKMPDRGYGQRLGNAVVSPDGKWLYFHDPSAFPAPGTHGNPVCRVPTTLEGKPELIDVPGPFGITRPVWLSPDGKTLRTVQYNSPSGQAVRGGPGILAIDAAAWTAGDVLPIPSAQLPLNVAVAVHPDGRAFVATLAGLTEFVPGGDRRLRPVLIANPGRGGEAPVALLRVSNNGRFLLAADADTPRNRLVLLDARPHPDRLEELAVLEGDRDLRVGGPFDVSPDGRFVVFRSGLVVRVDEGEAALKPLPKWAPPALPDPKAPVGPKPKDPGEIAPKPKPPAAVAPKPREVPAIPAATYFKGLTFYLAGDEVEGKAVKEAVTGKFVGEGQKPELVPGVRGKAVRVTAFAGGGGFDLSSQKAALAVAENKPFSIAVWVRRNDPDFPHLVAFHTATPLKADARTELTVRRDSGWSDGRALHVPDRRKPGGAETVLARGDTAGKAADWTHLAVVRGEDNELRFYANGAAMRPGARVARFTAALPFDVAWIGWVPTGHPPAFVEFDEFCVFDRALAADEVEKLAGKK